MQRATAGPQRLIEFLKETRQEMRKVHTPTRAEVQSTTIVVIGDGVPVCRVFFAGGLDAGPGHRPDVPVADEALGSRCGTRDSQAMDHRT